MSDRQEKFEKEQKTLYMENARSMYLFCIDIGLSKKESLVIAQLSLTLENLMYIREKTSNLQEFIDMAGYWHLKVEKNRIKSMQTYLQND